MDLSDHVYHYTDAHALLSIISNRTIWATDINFLNDKREGNVSRNYIRQFLRRKRKSPDFEMTDAIAEAIESFLGARKHAYVTSFVNRYDNLTMYRTYGPPEGGYCIGFKREYLRTVPNTRLVDMEYTKEVQQKETYDFLKQLVEDLVEKGDPKPSPQEASNQILKKGRFFGQLHDLSVSHKSSEFHTEDEIRLVSSAGWNDRKLRISSKGNVFIPYIEHELPNTETDVLITLGPNTAQELANSGFQHLRHIAQKNGTKWNIEFGVWELSGYRYL
tara:strand:+ start:163 stop:987 length:825 start_codon:yes stop_codon:yes gene_type:complete